MAHRNMIEIGINSYLCGPKELRHWGCKKVYDEMKSVWNFDHVHAVRKLR